MLQLKNLIEDIGPILQLSISGYTLLNFEKMLVELKEFLMDDFLSIQQCSDIVCEMRRISCLIKLFDLYCKIYAKKCIPSPTDHDGIVSSIQMLHQVHPESHKVSEEYEKEAMEFIKKLSLKYNVSGLSDEENIEIVAAVGLSKGHWFKCPNGYFYCIGEFCGATEESKCPECKAVIGGTNHSLADGNVHTGEMDGFSHAAWSDAANMLNFDHNDLNLLQL